jgi:hypothetical protein
MSKATDFAKAMAEKPTIRLKEDDRIYVFTVNARGELIYSVDNAREDMPVRLSAENALKLSAWIEETFTDFPIEG